MTLIEILRAAKSDLGRINKDELIAESARIPEVFHKYHTLYRGVKAEKISIQKEVKEKTKFYWEYYSGKADPQVYKERPLGKQYKTADVLKIVIAADPEMAELAKKQELLDEKEAALVSILDQINQRQWHIRNMNESMKFFNGNN